MGIFLSEGTIMIEERAERGHGGERGRGHGGEKGSEWCPPSVRRASMDDF